MHQKYEYPDLLAGVPMLEKVPHDIAIRAHGNEMYGDRKLSVEERAQVYLAENPQVYTAFKMYAFQLIRAGRTHIGAKMLAEKLRFESIVSGQGEFKINNTYVAYLARRFMKEFPEHEGIFETREKQA